MSDGLRYYQLEARDAVEQKLLVELVRSVLVVMPTGTGKTELFASIAKRWPKGDVLVLAHRDELVDQARARLERMTGAVVGVEKAGLRSSPMDHFVVGSAQTMMADKRMDGLGRDRFGLIIVDEGHHYVGNKFASPLEYFANASVLLVTATPDRSDGRSLGMSADSVAYVYDIEDAINDGYLVPLRAQEVDVTELDISDVGVSQGDLAAGQLDEAMLKAVEPVVRGIFEHGEDRPGVVFWPGVQSANYATERANALRPGSAKMVSGKTEKELRKRIIQEFRDGAFPLLFNCMVLTEGFDAPIAHMIGLARPTKSRALCAQTIGRGTRPEPGCVDRFLKQEEREQRRAAIDWSSKPDTLILNFVGKHGKHQLATPTDVLGGNYTEAEIKHAKKKRGDDPLENLRESRRELKALAEAVKANAKTTATEYDPLSVLDVDTSKTTAYDERFGRMPPSPAQVGFARSLGFTSHDLNGLSKNTVSRLLDKAVGRQKHGLATYAQMRALGAFGVTDKNITQDNAQKALDYAQRRWKFPSSIDHAELRAIARGEGP